MKTYQHVIAWVMLLVCLTVAGEDVPSWKNDNIFDRIINAKQEKLENLSFSELKFLTEFGFIDRNKEWLRIYEDSLSPSTRQQMKHQQRAITILAIKLASIESRFRVDLQKSVTDQSISPIDYIPTPLDLKEIKEKMQKEGMSSYYIIVLPDEPAMANRIVGVLSTFQHIAEQNNYFGLEYLFVKNIEKIEASKNIITVEPKLTNEQLYDIMIRSILQSTADEEEKIFVVEEKK